MDLKISVEEKGEIARNIHIAIPRAEYTRRFDDALSKATSRVNIKGFRPGRAPKAMVVKLYGSELHQEVMESLTVRALQTAFKEKELQVVGHPQVSFGENDPEKDVEINAAVDVYPTPTVSGYNKVAIEVPTRKFAEKDVEEEIKYLQNRQATFAPLTGRTVAEKGDVAKIDYTATIDGQPFPGSERKDVTIELGSGRLPEEIESGLVGCKVGDEKEITVTMSEDLRDKEIAGKPAVYKIQLHELQQKVLPELNDEFAKKTGQAEDLTGLKAKIKEEVEKQIETQNTQAKEKALFEKLIAGNTFEIPQHLVDEEIRSMLMEMGLLDRRKRESYDMDVSGFKQTLGSQAEYRVRSLVILDRVISQEKVEPTEAELEEWLDGLVTKGGFKSRDELNREFGYPESSERLKNILAREKTTEKLLAEAKITEVEPSGDENK